jgi:amino acid adenylation domain-containing protein
MTGEALDFDPFAGGEILLTAPSTEPQREIWTAARLGHEASLAFNESNSLDLHGALDVGALRAAFQDLVARHESLRATFSSDGTTLVVAAQASAALPLVELATLDEPERAARLAGILAAEVESPFDLEQGPLLRAQVLRLGPEHHRVIFTAHHIVCDGWSTAVLVKDWARLYSARVMGTPAALEPVQRFSDYARAQAANQGQASRVQAESYWVRQYEGAIPALELPAERPRPARKSFRARREDVTLDSELVRGLRRAGAREGASFFATLLASFGALLQRLTGQQELVIGIPAAGQAVDGQRALVGHCVNTLPLRLRVDPAEPFRALVKRARGQVLDAFEHQDLTFGALLQKLPLARDPSRPALVSVVLNVDQALPAEALAFAGLQVEFHSNPRHFETFDLFVNALDGGDGRCTLECQYNTDLYDRATLLRWTGALQTLARAALADMGTPVGLLPVLEPAERQRLLVAWNDTGTAPRGEARVHRLFSAQAARQPEAVALLGSEGTLSYAQLERRSNQLAQRLVRLGVAPDVPVGLCLERGFDTLVALLAILKAGGGYLPLESNYPRERLAFMLNDAAVPLVITQRSLLALLPEHAGRTLLLDELGAELAAEASTCPAVEVTADSLAYVIYTSGSTGRPKGTEIPHHAVVRLVCDVDYVGLGPEQTLLHAANLAFDASTFEIWGALLNGGRVALYPDSVPNGAGLQRAIAQYGVTTLWLTAALFNAVVDEDPALLRGARQVLTGGEALSVPHVVKALATLPETRLFNGYGPTESTTFATTWPIPPDFDARARAVPIGRPIRATRLYVLDPEFQPVPVGVVGQLYISGAGLARGYLKRPELTAERFLPDPFGDVPGARLYRTGDLVRYLPDGALDFVGRADDQVKVRGFRIELGEVEAALLAHPDVAQAAVIARRDRSGAQALVAYAAPRAGCALDEDGLLAHLQRSLPKFMLPQHLLLLERLPLNASGKVDRRALPAPVIESAAQAYAAPETQLESLVAELWQQALGIGRLGRHDNFFKLGGHSLLAAQVLSRLNREQGFVVPFRVVFEAPTVAQFAAHLLTLGPRTDASAASIPRRAAAGPAPVTLMQERLLQIEELLPESAQLHNVPASLRLRGPLDVGALRRSLDAFVRRHDMLRTTFQRTPTGYLQSVAPDGQADLREVDLTHLPEPARAAAVQDIVRAEVARALDLEHGPLMRCVLARVGADEWSLVSVRHNAVWDGWSFDLFRRDLDQLYAAQTGGPPARLPELSVGYADFAAWHREWLSGPEAQRQLAFWRRTLADAPGALELPLDRPRAGAGVHAGANEWLQLPRAEVDTLTELARAHDATLYMLLLAAFDVLLWRYTGEPDVLVASPARARNRPEIEDVLGLFTNTLTMRTRLVPEEPFTTLLARVRGTTLDAFSHQELPFDLLARELPPLRVIFSLQEARHRATSLGDVALHFEHVVQPLTSMDMNVWLMELHSGLIGAVNYNADLFDATTVQGLLHHYHGLLRAIARDPRTPLAHLALAEPAASAPAPASAPARRLVDWLAEHAQARGDALALAPTTTWSALAARVEARAAALVRQGVSPGQRVALTGSDAAETLLAMLSLWRVDAVPVCLEADAPPARRAAQLASVPCAWLWGNADELEALREQAALELPAALDTRPLPEHAEPLTSAPALVAPALDAPALVTFVPGADGCPRPLTWGHVGLAHTLASAGARLGLGPDDIWPLLPEAGPLERLLPVVLGAQSVAFSEDDVEDGERLARSLAACGATALCAPHLVWRLLLSADWQAGAGFVCLATEALPDELATALAPRAGPLWSLWGCEEAGGWVTLERVGPGTSRRAISSPLPGLDIVVLDDAGQVLPDGVPGELAIVGCALALGLGAPARSGARGRRLPDGSWQLLGRRDRRLFVRARRLEAEELRARLVSHAALADAEVDVREDARGEVRLVAWIVRRRDVECTDSELRRYLRRYLPDAAIPQRFVELEALPRTAGGDVDRRRLPTPFRALAASERAPQGAAEELLVELWREALGLPQVSVHDNFFDLGGHSLLCLQLVARIEARTSRRLKPRVFLLGTLAQAAAELERLQNGQS